MSFTEFLRNLLFPTKKSRISIQTRNSVANGWKKIQTLMVTKNPSDLKQAVLTADKLLDAVLRDLVPGETFGERLKVAKDIFSSWAMYQQAWEAHKVRNSMAHEIDYDPPYYICNDAITKYNAVLRDLGVL